MFLFLCLIRRTYPELFYKMAKQGSIFFLTYISMFASPYETNKNIICTIFASMLRLDASPSSDRRRVPEALLLDVELDDVGGARDVVPVGEGLERGPVAASDSRTSAEVAAVQVRSASQH